MGAANQLAKPTGAFIGASWIALALGIAWFALLASLLLLAAGLWNAELLLSEKGFYGIGFAMSLFAVVAVKKNIRDLAAHKAAYPEQHPQAGFLEKPEY